MYRFLSLFALCLVIFGCGGANEGSVNNAVVAIEKSFIGIVSSNTDYISDLEASHVLLTDANSKIYLQSFLHNLNDYQNSRVRVSGFSSDLNVADKTISTLEVNSIDLLDKVVVESESQQFETYSFEQLGLEINLPNDLAIKENEQSVFFSFANSNFTITPSVLKSEYDTYLINYSEYPSDLLRVDNHTFNLFLLSDYEHLYTLDLGHYVIEIKVSLFDNSLQSKIDLLLENIQFTTLPGSIFEVNQVLSTQEETIEPQGQDVSALEQQNNDTNESTLIESSVSQEIDSTEYASSLKIDTQNTSETQSVITDIVQPQTTSPYQTEINRFELSSKALLGDLTEISRYYFAESSHFYVEYINSMGENKRALISYANNLKVVARFVEDEVMDWRLVTGQNLVYDQKLTLVDASGKSHDLKEGFRLFESLPLEFSLQYPMQMYYMRNEDTYIFADDPNLKEISFTVSKVESFDSQKFNKVDSNIYFNGVDYIVNLDEVILQLTNKSLSIDVLNYILSTVSMLSL